MNMCIAGLGDGYPMRNSSVQRVVLLVVGNPVTATSWARQNKTFVAARPAEFCSGERPYVIGFDYRDDQ